MESLEINSLTPIIFEHACKKDFKNTIEHVLENEDFVSKIISRFSNSEEAQVKPVFMLIHILKSLHTSSVLYQNGAMMSEILSTVIDLLETTFSQFNFISLKKYFTFTSELKLLDLLNVIYTANDFSDVVKKLNRYFPRWTPSYRAELENKFSIDNSKILDKIEEGHAQCRKLILQLTVDRNHRENYFKEQYTTDHNRMLKESEIYVKEVVKVLQFYAGSSKLETIIEDAESIDSNDVNMQLLLEYIVPDISDETLIKFLEDLEPTLQSQPSTTLTCCLHAFDLISEDEDSESCDSEYEYSQSGSQPINSQENN